MVETGGLESSFSQVSRQLKIQLNPFASRNLEGISFLPTSLVFLPCFCAVSSDNSVTVERLDGSRR